MQQIQLALATALLLALSGCSDGGGGDGPGTTSSSTTSTGPDNTTAPPPMEPIVLTGPVSGAQDCTLAQQSQAPVSAVSVTIPAEAANRTYSLTFSGGQTVPTASSICIGFGTNPLNAGNSGTIAPGTTTARIGMNAGQGVTYTLTIT